MKHRPMNREEKEELRLLRELAQAKGKTLCTMQEMFGIMGRQEFIDAVYEKKIVSCGSIGQRSYYLY